MALTSIPVKKQSVSFSLLELAYEILGKVEDLAACIRRELQKGQQQALLPVREGKFLSQLPDELRLLVDEHIPGSMTQVFFIYMKLADQLRNDTLRDGACFFFVLADGSLA
jgi:hypothetical protein